MKYGLIDSVADPASRHQLFQLLLFRFERKPYFSSGSCWSGKRLMLIISPRGTRLDLG
jgi:hypothetical protein